uniref:Uncharacterized protein n=1 Tax=Lepeophtheirus salmonis TaxID=72036 RepID=A0A0K2UUN3_LEPSM
MFSKVSIPTILYIQKRFSSTLAVLAIILNFNPGSSCHYPPQLVYRYCFLRFRQ